MQATAAAKQNNNSKSEEAETGLMPWKLQRTETAQSHTMKFSDASCCAWIQSSDMGQVEGLSPPN
jgi:hypothetical protein